MADENKKNIFDRAIDALTNRDEKEAEEKARLKAMADKEALVRAQMEAEKAKAELAKTQAAAAAKAQAEADAKEAAAERAARTADAESAAKAADAMRAQMAAAKEAAEKKAAEEAAAKAAAVIKHVWTGDDTYASLAQKYYGSFKEPYWRLIYEFNKAIIGNHPNDIRVGLEIGIPPLPDELKLKK